MKNTLAQLIWVGMLILTLASCDVYSYYIKEIKNDSGETIKIYLTGNSARLNLTDSIIVAPGSSNLYYNHTGDRIRKLTCMPDMQPDEISVTISGNKSLKKDITDRVNWTCETDEKNTFWKSTFTIATKDIE